MKNKNLLFIYLLLMAEKIVVNNIELFKINNYQNYYISKNCDIYNKLTERFLKPTLDTGGYYRIGLYKNKVTKFKSVHRLLGETFIENDDPETKTTIDHINRIRTDNRLENLQWSDRSGQIFNQGLKKNNTSGKKGVCIGGNNIRAQWYEDGLRKSKSFNIKKFGFDEAFRLACEYRKAKMKELHNIVE